MGAMAGLGTLLLGAVDKSDLETHQGRKLAVRGMPQVQLGETYKTIETTGQVPRSGVLVHLPRSHPS